MSISDDVHEQLRAYLARRISLDDLFRWLAGHVRDISMSGDEALRDLDAQVWLRVNDIDEGTGTEEDLREWLRGEPLRAAEVSASRR